jgi:histidine triad (HIT) family protein
MYNHAPADYVCPLCQISRGEVTEKGPSEQDIIFQTDVITVFIASKWWPNNPGHVIVIPNEHIENLYDMPEEIGHAIFDASKQIAVALKETYKCDGISTRQHNEPAGNQDAWHYHLHVFPRYEGDNLYLSQRDSFWVGVEEKKPYADKLRQYFAKK